MIIKQFLFGYFKKLSEQDQGKEQRLGKLLFGISVLFIFCQSFKMVPDIYELIFCPPSKDNNGQCETTPFVSMCVSLSHLLVCGNSALNWIVYLLAGEKFRSAWSNTYLPKKCRPDHHKRSDARYQMYSPSLLNGKNITRLKIYLHKTMKYLMTTPYLITRSIWF